MYKTQVLLAMINQQDIPNKSKNIVHFSFNSRCSIPTHTPSFSSP